MCEKSKKIRKTEILKKDYPLNLLLAITDIWDLNTPEEITSDIRSGIQYALSTLKDREQEVLYQRYVLRKKLSEIANMLSVSPERVRGIEYEALRELRSRSKFPFIKYGVQGCIQILKTQEYDRGYQVGYSEGYDKGCIDASNGCDNPGVIVNITKLPIEALDLSVRSYNCLRAAGYETIGDIKGLSLLQIKYIRNLGIKCCIEIAQSLRQYGVIHTAWDRYVDD